MTIGVGLVLLLGLTHWVADFLLQSDKMAIGKSQNTPNGIYQLTLHVLVYTACFIWTGSIPFLIFTAWLHWLTDFTTSRVNSKLWFLSECGNLNISDSDGNTSRMSTYIFKTGGERHWFFVAIGFDQFLHFFALLAGAVFYL